MNQRLRPFSYAGSCWGQSLWLIFLLCAASLTAQAQPAGPELLTHDELIRLYEPEVPSAPLQAKLTRLLTTPFVSNEAAARGAKPHQPQSPVLGKFLRVVCWNIERGLELDAIRRAFTDPAGFSALLDKAKYPRGGKKHKLVLQQVAVLQEADVVVLNEVDWGMKRSGYRHVTAELAAALGMNYAYGVEFIEVNSIALGIEKFDDASPEDKAKLAEYIKVDPARYRGLHGTAILSRYRLDNVRLVPFTFQGHDWYADEKKGVALIEAGKRFAGKQVFLEKVLPEVRRGGRMMLLADITDAALHGGKATIVATHLESRTKPRNRVKQLEELLAQIKDIKHPVIVAGDMNTSTKDMTPTSLGRELKKRLGSESFWVKQGIKYATGVGLLLDVVIGGLRFSRTQADPTVRSIPLVSSNPEAKFFEVLKDFRFSDGGAFDFRGEKERTINRRARTLANSNERGQKGFVTTYEVERTIGPAGKYKLDWFFIKPPVLTEPRDKQQPHRFAPHFGRTLRTLNYAGEGRISDHSPIAVDLPFAEPRIPAKLPARRQRRAPRRR